MITIYTDGGARGNPGPAGIGVVIEQDGKTIKELSAYIGETTNNVAEYEALIRGLKFVIAHFGNALKDMQIEVKMDSELVVRQLSGVYKVKDEKMKEKFGQIAQMRLESTPNMIFTHIPREKNSRADELVNEAIDKA